MLHTRAAPVGRRAAVMVAMQTLSRQTTMRLLFIVYYPSVRGEAEMFRARRVNIIFAELLWQRRDVV